MRMVAPAGGPREREIGIPYDESAADDASMRARAAAFVEIGVLAGGRAASDALPEATEKPDVKEGRDALIKLAHAWKDSYRRMFMYMSASRLLWQTTALPLVYLYPQHNGWAGWLSFIAWGFWDVMLFATDYAIYRSKADKALFHASTLETPCLSALRILKQAKRTNCGHIVMSTLGGIPYAYWIAFAPGVPLALSITGVLCFTAGLAIYVKADTFNVGSRVPALLVLEEVKAFCQTVDGRRPLEELRRDYVDLAAFFTVSAPAAFSSIIELVTVPISGLVLLLPGFVYGLQFVNIAVAILAGGMLTVAASLSLPATQAMSLLLRIPRLITQRYALVHSCDRQVSTQVSELVVQLETGRAGWWIGDGDLPLTTELLMRARAVIFPLLTVLLREITR